MHSSAICWLPIAVKVVAFRYIRARFRRHSAQFVGALGDRSGIPARACEIRRRSDQIRIGSRIAMRNDFEDIRNCGERR